MILKYLREVSFIKKAHNSFMALLTDDLREEERKKYEKKLKFIESIYEQESEKKEVAHKYEIDRMKKEIDMNNKKNEDQLKQEKRMISIEMSKAEQMQMNAMKAEDRFIQMYLKIEELVYKVKKINEVLQQLTVAEYGLEKLIYDIENPSNKNQEKLDKLQKKIEVELKN